MIHHGHYILYIQYFLSRLEKSLIAQLLMLGWVIAPQYNGPSAEEYRKLTLRSLHSPSLFLTAERRSGLCAYVAVKTRDLRLTRVN